jgi:hypothetical protein
MAQLDPIRGAGDARRAARSQPQRRAGGEVVNLPVPVEPVRRIEPRSDRRPAGAAFAAHLIGQDGQKRGLRAGPELIDAARRAYNRAEWSGSKDRRAPTGAVAKASI